MFLQGLYVTLLSWCNSHVGSTWFLVYDVGSWCGQVRSLKISFSWMIAFLIGLAIIHWWQFMQSCYFAHHDLHDCVILPIMIYKNVLFCWSQFKWLCYVSGSKVWTPGQTVWFFYWSWVWFPGQIPCFRPVWFMAYVMVCLYPSLDGVLYRHVLLCHGSRDQYLCPCKAVNV